MKIRVLGAYGAEGLGQRPTSFLVNDRILIDAGTVGGALTLPEQSQIEHALITHSHLDHVAGLAFLAATPGRRTRCGRRRAVCAGCGRRSSNARSRTAWRTWPPSRGT